MTAGTGLLGLAVVRWTWFFGDGTSATGQTVQKTYTAPGVYTVTIQAQSVQGTATATTTANISGATSSTQISAGGPYSGLVGQPITMTASVIAVGFVPTLWTWSFGDGTTASGQTVQKTYTIAGTYTVTVQAQNQFGAVGAFTATTTATITGSTTAGTSSPALSTTSVALVTGCNNIAATWPDGTAPSTVVAAVAPAGLVVAVWRAQPGTQQFVGYAPTAPVVSDLQTINRFDALFICTTGPATLARPVLS
jgi:PKD repeat protein